MLYFLAPAWDRAGWPVTPQASINFLIGGEGSAKKLHLIDAEFKFSGELQSFELHVTKPGIVNIVVRMKDDCI